MDKYTEAELKCKIQAVLKANGNIPLDKHTLYDFVAQFNDKCNTLQSEIIALKQENERLRGKRLYQIDYGNHLRCKIKVTDKGIDVEGAVNGWGDGVPLSEIIITPLNPTDR